MINAGEVVLKRWDLAWVEESTAAVRESLPELQKFLPWATDTYDVEASRAFIGLSTEEWDKGTTMARRRFRTRPVVGLGRRESPHAARRHPATQYGLRSRRKPPPRRRLRRALIMCIDLPMCVHSRGGFCGTKLMLVVE